MVEDILDGNNTNVRVQTTMRLHVPPGPAFDADVFMHDITVALGIGTGDIEVTGVDAIPASRRLVIRRMQAANSTTIEIHFVISSPQVMDALRSLAEQIDDSTMSLTVGTLDPNYAPSYSFVCPAAMMRPVGAPQCSVCGAAEVPNEDQTGCTPCQATMAPSLDGTQCVCQAGSYSISDLPVIQCFDLDFFVATPETSAAGCYTCPSCLQCTAEETILQVGYRFVEDDAPIAQARFALRCPSAAACPEQTLQASLPDPSPSSPRLVSSNCSTGHRSLLCAKCKVGFKRGPADVCEPCSVTTTGMLSPLLLVPAVLALLYFALGRYFKFTRENRRNMRGGAQLLFDEIDANLSGHVTREEARSGLAALGLSVSDDVAIDVVDAISVDQTEHINRVEFEAWLRRDVSKHMVRPSFALIANHHTNLSKRFCCARRWRSLSPRC